MTGRAMSAGTAETRSGSGRQPASAVANGDGPQPTDNREIPVTPSEQQAVPVAHFYPDAAAKLVKLLTGSNVVADDARTLVIAAREFWDPREDGSPESRALLAALESFSSRVPYEDEPAALGESASHPCKSGEGAGEIEQLAQFLHDEGGFGDAMTDRTWPEHDGDTGQRENGWVKIVPSDVVAKFRDVARRWLLPRTALTPDATQTREAEGVSVAEYNEVYDKFEEVVGGAFRDGFQEGWVFALTPDGTDYDDRQEEYGRTVDIEPSEAWEGYRDKYEAMLPVPALPALNARGGA